MRLRVFLQVATWLVLYIIVNNNVENIDQLAIVTPQCIGVKHGTC